MNYLRYEFPFLLFIFDDCIPDSMNHNAIKEVTPLRETECFTVFHREKEKFDFPYHYHEEYELNMILHAKGVRRIVGDRMEEIGDLDFVEAIFNF